MQSACHSKSSKMVALTSLTLRDFCWECLILGWTLYFLLSFLGPHVLFITAVWYLLLALSLVMMPQLLQLEIAPVPQDNNHVTLQMFGEIPSGRMNSVSSLDHHRNMELCQLYPGRKVPVTTYPCSAVKEGKNVCSRMWIVFLMNIENWIIQSLTCVEDLLCVRCFWYLVCTIAKIPKSRYWDF